MADVSFLDVTLRDVASVNDWRFTDEQIAATTSAVDAAGYEFIELGYFVPSGQIAGIPRTGPGVCDAAYLQSVCGALRRAKPAVMVRMSDVPLGELGKLSAAGVSLVRMPIHPHEVAQTAEYIAACHALGMRVSVNLIFLSQRTTEEVVTTAAAAQGHGADLFCLADTLSGLVPDQTAAVVSAAKRELSIPLGFHAHDGLRCAFANALAAVRAGATILDSSLGGIGSGGSNLMTELITAYAVREWGRSADIAALTRVTAAHLSEWAGGNVPGMVEAALAGLLNLNTRQRAAASSAAATAGLPLLEYLSAELRARSGNPDERARVTRPYDPASLAANHGDHFYLADPERFAANLNRFHRAFAARLPRVAVAYSIKTNYLPTFLRIAHEGGHSVEAVSGFEYELALLLGFPPRRVILNGPVKSPALLARACAAESRVHLDAGYEVEELERLARAADPTGWRIGLRCNLGLPDFPSRFGFDVASGELADAAGRLAGAGIRFRGLHAHVATQPKTLAAFRERLTGLLRAADRLFTDRPPEYLDVGGGFHPPAAGAGPTFDEYAAVAAEELAARYGTDRPELIVEPGVSVASDTMTYVCRILGVKEVGGQRIAITTGGIHTIRPTGYERHSAFSLAGSTAQPQERIALGGYTCMEHDRIPDVVPATAKAGDFLIVTNVGAYTTVFKPPFIDLAPPILVPDGDGWRAVRRAESAADILAAHADG